MRVLFFSLLFVGFFSFNSWAEVEASFIMNNVDIRFDAGNERLFVTQGYFQMDPNTKVDLMPGNERNKVIFNKPRGVYMSTDIGQTVKGQKVYTYPTSITEAKREGRQEALYSYTVFDGGTERAAHRTNCANGPDWSNVSNRATQSFKCTTVTTEFCKKLEDVKLAMGAKGFNEAAQQLGQCQRALSDLSVKAKGLKEYVATKEYRDLSEKMGKNLFGLRNNKDRDIGLEQPKGLFNSVNLETLGSDDFDSLEFSDIRGMIKSMQAIKSSVVACAALEDANATVNKAIFGKNMNSGGGKSSSSQ